MKINEITEMQGQKPSVIKNLKPGQSAEIDHGDGTKTMIDLKKNPTALQKDPKTKKVTLTKKQQPGQKANPATQAKRGDKVVVAPQ
tara:strand:+ start:3626 stop:3883 length:258 start_codon:yes stop_codon:yes gene_type:complete